MWRDWMACNVTAYTSNISVKVRRAEGRRSECPILSWPFWADVSGSEGNTASLSTPWVDSCMW